MPALACWFVRLCEGKQAACERKMPQYGEPVEKRNSLNPSQVFAICVRTPLVALFAPVTSHILLTPTSY